MARQVTVTVQCAGKPLAPGQDFQALVLHQTLFDHHSLSLLVPFDRVEGSKSGFLGKAPQQFLGREITVAIATDKEFEQQGHQSFDFTGLVTEIGTSKESDLSNSLTIHGYSPCCQLATGVQKRTFINQTLTAIFEQVLTDVPANLLARQLNPNHKAPIAYAVQYKESDFAFLSRLAAEYGEWFFHDGLVLRLGLPTGGKELDFIADGVHNSFHLGLSLGATRVKFYEYNYLNNQHYSASTKDQDVPAVSRHAFGKLALEQSERLFPQESRTMAEVFIKSASELTQEAKDFKAQRAADLIALQGGSDNPSVQLGCVIKVGGQGLGSNAEQAEDFGAYRIVEVTHTVDEAGNYSNTFTAIPHFLEIPPLNPNYAPPAGLQELAEIIDTDDPSHLGRVRVRYYWSVAKPQDAESDWIRVMTPYSGDGKGQLFTPEIGSQVLIGYEQGLAEFPLVLGNLFHAQNKQGAKYTTPNNRLKGLQTAGGNKFVMSDVAGAQTILLSNSNKKTTAITVSFENDGKVHIQSAGPVAVNGSSITLEAGAPGKGGGPYTGDILLRAKTITMEAEEDVATTSKKAGVTTTAKTEISNQVVEGTMKVNAKTKTITTTEKLEVSGGPLVSIKGGKVKINS